jgi:RNA polymerase sigma-70 factor (ECF subfamily)
MEIQGELFERMKIIENTGLKMIALPHGIITTGAVISPKIVSLRTIYSMTLFPWPRNKAKLKGASFEELALPLVPALYNFACSLSRDTHESEDLVQETLLKALKGFPSFEPESNFKAWIFRILRNTFLTSRTGIAAMRTVALDDEIGKGADDGEHPASIVEHRTPEINLMHLEDRAAVQRALEKLPRPLLEVVILCDVEELKYKEIASVLDIPIGTVMSRIARARASLRNELRAGNAKEGVKE